MSSSSAPPHWNAADYAKSSAGQQIWARELIAKLNLAGHERVLDIGCGDGKVTAELAAAVARGGAVLGIDNSPGMIAHARATFTSIPNLRFEQMDASALTLPAGDFDVVFSNAALHWVRDHRPVLRGIAHALKPGGRALLQMGGRANAAELVGAVGHVAGAPSWRQYFTDFVFPYGFHGPDDYAPWLAAVDLRPVRLELIPKDLVHPDRAAFEGWLRTTWMPWTQRVPADQQAAFIDQVVDAYAKAHPPDEGGRYHVHMVRLEVEAARV